MSQPQKLSSVRVEYWAGPNDGTITYVNRANLTLNLFTPEGHHYRLEREHENLYKYVYVGNVG